MFRPKKFIKLEPLSSSPSINDLERVLGQVGKIRGCTFELPWQDGKSEIHFALAVRIELGGEEAFWTMYKGDGLKSRPLWSAPFSDMSLLKEVIALSIVEATHGSVPPLAKNSADSEFISPSASESEHSKFSGDKDRDYLTAHFLEDKPAGHSEQVKADQLDKNAAQDNRESHSYRLTESPFFVDEKKDSSKEDSSKNLSTNQPIIPSTSQNNVPQYPPNTYTNPNNTGGNPALPPIPGQQPPAYAYFYPGYPYAIPYPYPPGPPMPQPMATSVPLQPRTSIPDPDTSSSRMPSPDAELLKKQTNFMLGQFLIDSKLIKEPTLRAVLKLQEMIVGNVISKAQAVETISRIHHQGGVLDIAQLISNSTTGGNKAGAAKQSHPLLGELLVRAKVLDNSTLEAILKMQEIVRSGAITKDEACQAINKELSAGYSEQHKIRKTEAGKEPKIVDLLVKSGLINAEDRDAAYKVQKKHGGSLYQILVSARKLNEKTYEAAIECESMLAQDAIKIEQAIIALNYCERSRVNMSDALEELDFGIEL